jgi:hypothetical protein
VDIVCLFTHKCTVDSHEIGARLKTQLRREGIELSIDPFEPGHHTTTRIDTLPFDSVLFLWSPEGETSFFCRREIQTAERRLAPLFVAVDSEVPMRSFQRRILWVRPRDNSPDFARRVAELAGAIRYRVTFNRELRRLDHSVPVEESRDAAERIAMNFDRTILAENVAALGRLYLQMNDYTGQYWIAIALGSAGTEEAARVLNNLPEPDHTLVLEGLREARETVGQGTQPSTPKRGNDREDQSDVP